MTSCLPSNWAAYVADNNTELVYGTETNDEPHCGNDCIENRVAACENKNCEEYCSAACKEKHPTGPLQILGQGMADILRTALDAFKKGLGLDGLGKYFWYGIIIAIVALSIIIALRVWKAIRLRRKEAESEA